jgi:hypothetical protein
MVMLFPGSLANHQKEDLSWTSITENGRTQCFDAHYNVKAERNMVEFFAEWLILDSLLV